MLTTMQNTIGQIGRSLIVFLQDLSSIVALFRETVVQTMVLLRDRRKRLHSRVLQEVDEVGMHSLTLVLVVSSMIGLLVTVLVSYQWKEFGSLRFIPGFVAATVFRGLGPLITALVIIGKVGAAYTARLGTMKVTEEVLALETMAISPVRFIVVQRLFGLMIALPALTVLGNFTAVAMGFLLGSAQLGIPPDVYLRETIDVLTFTDIVSGVVRSLVYAVVIVMVGCYRGLVVEGGAEEVGRATMVSVVSTTLAVIIIDTVMTGIFYG